MSIIQNQISQLSSNVGLDEASLKILLCTLLSFPFGIIFKRLPDQNYLLKNLYNVAVSAFYIFGICALRGGLVTLLISSSGSYFITRYLRTSSMPWVNFLFLMTHMAYSHFHLQFFVEYDPTVIDITGAQMILVMKLSAFGWNIHDGKQPQESLSEYNKSRAIKRHPNILPFIGYVFFYASLLTGPAFDYIDYDKFIHSTLFDDLPEEKRPGRKRKRKIPKSGVQAFKKVCMGFFWAFLLFQLPKLVTSDYMFTSDFVQKHNLGYRIIYMWILGFNYRLKYYTIWTIAEGACILCGIGYNGYDESTGEIKWNRVQNIDPWAFELGQNVHACLEAWNQNTNKWLKYYVYLRVAKPGKKPGFKSTMFTFATSAFWHGTRPGYYLTFIVGALLQTVAKFYRRNFRPIFLEADGKTPKPSKKLYDLVCWINTQLAFGFFVQPFVLLGLGKSLQCWKTVHFWLVWVIFISFFAFTGPFKKQVSKFFKSYNASALLKEKKIGTSDASENRFKLNAEESDIVHSAINQSLERNFESPTLGLPSIDVLQKIDKEEIDNDFNDWRKAWNSFKSRRHSRLDDDFEGLKDAYNNFANEINEIITDKKKEFEREMDRKNRVEALDKDRKSQ